MGTEHSAFKELYDRYANDVYRFAFWLCGDVDTAKDITAETFARCWTNSKEIRMESVKAYLFTIARNVHLQERRRHKHSAPLDHEPMDPSAQAGQMLEARSDLEYALSALRELDEVERSVLLMRAYDELSYADIARATGLTITAVKVKAFRARAKLSAMLSPKRNKRP